MVVDNKKIAWALRYVALGAMGIAEMLDPSKEKKRG